MKLELDRQESPIESALVRACQREGWEVRKQVWPGHRGAPDRIILADEGVTVHAETKRPKGGELSPDQAIEHAKLKGKGHAVVTVFNEMDIARTIALVRKMVLARRGGCMGSIS